MACLKDDIPKLKSIVGLAGLPSPELDYPLVFRKRAPGEVKTHGLATYYTRSDVISSSCESNDALTQIHYELCIIRSSSIGKTCIAYIHMHA